MDIRLVHLDEDARPDVSAACLGTLDESERERANTFQLPAARRQFIFGRALVRVCLTAAVGGEVRPGDWKIESTDSGKPFVRNGPGFSLSHASGLAACATGDGPVGLDVERIRPRVDLSAMAKGLTEAERVMLGRLSHQASARQFAFVWTAKEAAAKACGRGLAVDFRNVLLQPTSDGFAVRGSAGEWAVWQTEARPGYCLAVATERQVVPALHLLSTDELLRSITSGSS